jgi:hypothetical protein
LTDNIKDALNRRLAIQTSKDAEIASQKDLKIGGSNTKIETCPYVPRDSSPIATMKRKFSTDFNLDKIRLNPAIIELTSGMTN